MTRILVVAQLLLMAACGSSAPERRTARTPPRSAPPAAAEAPARPRIVVAVILDQLPSHALDRYLPLLPEDGAIRGGIARGAFHRQVVYPYAGTYTAPGHAAIYTGAPPAVTGVMSNEVWDYERNDSVATVDDGEHAIHGAEGFASPSVLRVETVADALERATEGRAIVASLSWKDRAAILGGGRRPDLVLWYEKAIPGFTTSAYYGEALPEWVARFSAERPVSALMVPWSPDETEALGRIAGPDDAPGEGSWHGFGATFPHDPGTSERPLSTVRATPQSTDYLLDLAATAVEELGMGDDEVPDFLAVSISATDYIGHVFGCGSWEYADNLRRTDRALAAFLAALEREHGPIGVLVTSDHGAPFLPERLQAEGRRAGRLAPSRVRREVEAALDRALGPGDWLAAYVQPFLYLTPAARAPDVRPRAVGAAIAWLAEQPDVEAAFDASEAAAWREVDHHVRRSVALSVTDDAPGDVFVVPAEHFVVDEDADGGYGTSHGSPWDYDQVVPAVFWGPGVTHVETTEPLHQGRVATTLTRLLGVPPPEAAPADPLPGAP